MSDPAENRPPSFLAGGGRVGELLRAHRWDRTPLGDPAGWPQSLKTIVQIMQASSQPMFVTWGPQRTLIYNESYSQILGAKHPGALGHDFLDVWEEIRSDLLPIVTQAYRGEPVQMDDIKLIMLRHGYPEEAHFSFFYAPVRDDSGTVGGLFCACAETTGQVMAQRRLAESEARHRGVLANMDEAFVLLDRDFRVLEVNEEALRQDRRPRDAIVGRTLWELHPGVDEHPFGRLYSKVMQERTPGVLEHPFRWPDGRETWNEVRAYPTAEGLAIVFRDITERRRIEHAAHAAAERVQLALDAGAIIGTWVWDVTSDRIVADERFARSFGLDVDLCRTGLPLEQVVQYIHPDDRAQVVQAIADALARGGSYRCEYRVRPDGANYRWVEANGRVERDEAGQPVRFPGVLLDIEERRRAEAERDRATSMLRTFTEAVPGVVYAKDREGRMLVANRGAATLIGKPLEAFIGKTDAEFLDDPAQGEAIMATDRRIMETGVPEQVEEEIRLPDGTGAVWLSTKAPLRDAEGRVIGLVGSSVDITDRKRQQEKARVEAEMLDVLNQTGTQLAAELDLTALLQNVTDAATKLTGARFGAFFYNGVDEQGEAYMLYTLSGAPRDAFDRFGHPRPTPMFAPTFRGAAPIRVDDVLADPRYGHWAPHHGMPPGHLPVRSYLAVSVTSRRGDVLGGLFFAHPEPGVFTERSERLAVGIAAQAAAAIDNARLYAEAQKAAEERRQLLESERAARTEAERASSLKDEFLATLSHELRTPLSAILGWAHILRLKVDAGDAAVQKGIDVIERNTRVQTQLIEDLLDMSRITSGKLKLHPEPLALITFVQAAVEAVGPAAREASIRIALEARGDEAMVMGDAARLQQVVWNLLSNAIKFSSAGSEVRVTLESDGAWARVSVADQGAGIAPEFLPHVFDRFRQADGSTTRRHGGLGLGLSIVRHLAELHGGTVTAHSGGPGRGATFVVSLPRHHPQGADEPTLPVKARQAWSDVDLAGLPVLVVDDEPDVLDLIARVLREAGAQVRTASNAQEALSVLRTAAPRVLVSDIGMPEMDGYELLRRARRLETAGARLTAIALTAFARPEDRKRALDAGFDEYLSKPMEPQELVLLVSRLSTPAAGGQDR
jgi:PAS domain S-box-containing protein